VALNALIFLYRQHLHIELGELGFTLASKQRRLPTVLSKTEVRKQFNWPPIINQ
jgi:hypothetical protein